MWFKNRQVFCFASLIQVTKSLSTPKFLKDFSYVFNPFNNFVPPLHLVDNLVLGCERDGRGSSFRPIIAMVPSIFGQFFLEGT